MGPRPREVKGPAPVQVMPVALHGYVTRPDDDPGAPGGGVDRPHD